MVKCMHKFMRKIESRTIFRTCTILQIKQHFSSEMNFYIILSFLCMHPF